MHSQHEWSPQRASCYLIAVQRGEIKWLLKCRLVWVALNSKGLYLTLSSILAFENSAFKTSHFHGWYTSTLLHNLIQQLLGRRENCTIVMWKQLQLIMVCFCQRHKTNFSLLFNLHPLCWLFSLKIINSKHCITCLQ